MNRRWIQLLERDTGARWSVLASSMLITALTGLVLDLNGVSVATAKIIAIVIGGVAFLIQGSFYTSNPKLKPLPKIKKLPKSVYLPLITIPSVAVIALIISITAPTVLASVLNRRLQVVLAIDSPAKRKTEAAKIIKIAAQSNVQLNANLVSIATEKAEVNEWPAYLETVSNKFSSHPNDSSYNSHLAPYDLGRNGTYSNVSFIGYRIIYHGGPLVLENVRFQDCIFDIDETENGKKLVAALLASKDATVSMVFQ
jgi:hypothetical protein